MSQRRRAPTPELDAGALRPELVQGLNALGITHDLALADRLLEFLTLLVRWNRTYNLTAIRDPREMVRLHLLDALAVLPILENSALAGRDQTAPRLADVGSGAGIPAIPLALARPGWKITSIEAVDKKAAFQRQAKIALGLKNLEVCGARVESLLAGGHDLVLSRAFASLADFVSISGHLAAPHGALAAMKGLLPDDEIASLPAPWQVDAVLPLIVPGVAAERHLLLLRKA